MKQLTNRPSYQYRYCGVICTPGFPTYKSTLLATSLYFTAQASKQEMKPTFSILVAFGLLAYAVALPIEDELESSEEVGTGREVEELPNKGILQTIKDEIKNIEVDLQIKKKDGFHDFCLRIHALKSLLGDKVIKPCVGIDLERTKEETSNLIYRFRIGRLTIYTGKVAFKRKLSSCKNVPLFGKICLKDLTFDNEKNEAGEKLRKICFMVGVKSKGVVYDVCGTFHGTKLVDHKCEQGAYDESNMEALPENTDDVIDELDE